MANQTVVPINPETFEQQLITTADSTLITQFELDGKFDVNKNSVELYVYNTNKVLVQSNYNYLGWTSYQNLTPANQTYLEDLVVDPVYDATNQGLTNGTNYIVYNFVRNELSSSNANRFYISNISTDRTIVNLETVDYEDLTLPVEELKSRLGNSTFFTELYLNFGENVQLIGVNVRLVGNIVQIKLYEPLPLNFTLKTTCWLQTRVADPVAYSVTSETTFEEVDTKIYIKGPNTNLKLKQQVGNSNTFQNQQQLQSATSNLGIQLTSLLNDKGIDINIDYSNFENFVHFSTATQRLYNYEIKLNKLISYSSSLSNITTGGYSTQQVYKTASLDIIKNFDGYEYYLYYTLNLTSSAYFENWMGTPGWEGTGMLGSASRFDMDNQTNLVYSLPEYIREDEANTGGVLFVEMLGQYFDTFYLYTKALSDRYNTDNRLNFGISKNLVAEALKSFGVKLYENNFSNVDLYSALIGLTPTGLIPNQTIQTGSLGLGEEWITTVVSASNQQIPLGDLNLSIYKRLYHNLPTLVKRKGTLAGLQQLITLYGIPNTILNVLEYGGKDKNEETWDFWQNTYNYALSGTSEVTSSFNLNSLWGATNNKPETVVFKIKTLNTSSSEQIVDIDNKIKLFLYPHTSSVVSGSFLGQPEDEYYNYATASLVFSSGVSASIFMPFYNQEWWTLGFSRNTSTDLATLFAQSTTSNGIDATTIMYATQSKVDIQADTSWATSTNLNLSCISGSLQELRYYNVEISQSTLNNFTVNGDSIELFNNLAFRASLGGEMYTGSVSIHPNQKTSSFASNSNFTILSGSFNGQQTIAFYNQFAVGIQNPVSSKIQTTGSQIIDTVLSQYVSLEQKPKNYTQNTNYVEVGFSPSNEVNKDIGNQLGNINIGEYIGDPSFQFEEGYTYPSLDVLQKEYFAKYTSNYNIYDYLRLIRYFDNSLFKIIEDFTPAKTALSTGTIIKQTYLERNRQKQATVVQTGSYYTSSIQSYVLDYKTGSLYSITGGPAGSVNQYNNDNQAWSSSLNTIAGKVNTVEKSRYEFYNGEFSGSNLQPRLIYSLNENPLENNVSSSRLSNLFEKVEYGFNSFQPTNIVNILSGSAEKAAVQDSNYSLGSAWERNRYGGVKLTSQKLNEYTVGDVSYGKTPVVEQTNTFMVYYDWAGATLAERQGSANYHVQYLIDELGTLIKPEYSSSYYWNMEQAFGAETKVNVTNYNSATQQSTVKETTVYQPVKQFNTILYTSTGSLGTDFLQKGYYSSISFIPDPLATQVNFHASLSADYTTAGIVKFDSVIQDEPVNTYSTTTGIYTCYTSSGLIVDVQVSIEAYNGDVLPQDVIVDVYKSSSILTTFTISSIPSTGTGYGSVTIADTYEEGKEYRVETNISPGDSVVAGSNTFFKINTRITGNTVNTTGSWSINGLSFDPTTSNKLTSSLALGEYYTGAYLQQPKANSGFNTPIKFSIQRYDQIRFEGNEDYVFTIADVNYENGRIYLTLDRQIPYIIGPLGVIMPKIDLNNFSIKRLVPDAGFLILNYQEGKGPGFIIPKYPSPKLKDNISAIIKDFAEKNLI